MSTMPRSPVDLAHRTERVLVDLALAGSEPIHFAALAETIAQDGEGRVTAPSLTRALGSVRDRGSRSWSAKLTAFVVDAATGEPGPAYAPSGQDDAATVRASTHRRLADGIWAID